MAETKEVKKRAPKKPKTVTEIPSEVKEEVAPKEIAEPEEEIAPKEEEIVETMEEVVETPAISEEDMKLPEDVTPFEKFEEIAPKEEPEEELAPKEEATTSSSKIAAKIKKLNPYLEDLQSKWIAVVEVNGLVHKLFKGSYAKALNAAENYNISKGIGKGQVIKIRK